MELRSRSFPSQEFSKGGVALVQGSAHQRENNFSRCANVFHPYPPPGVFLAKGGARAPLPCYGPVPSSRPELKPHLKSWVQVWSVCPQLRSEDQEPLRSRGDLWVGVDVRVVVYVL